MARRKPTITYHWARDKETGKKVILSITTYPDKDVYVEVLGYRESDWPLDQFKLLRPVT